MSDTASFRGEPSGKRPVSELGLITALVGYCLFLYFTNSLWYDAYNTPIRIHRLLIDVLLAGAGVLGMLHGFRKLKHWGYGLAFLSFPICMSLDSGGKGLEGIIVGGFVAFGTYQVMYHTWLKQKPH